jgi:hypothetical protein
MDDGITVSLDRTGLPRVKFCFIWERLLFDGTVLETILPETCRRKPPMYVQSLNISDAVRISEMTFDI